MDWTELLQTNGSKIDILSSLRGLVVVLLVGQLIAYHYKRFSSVLSNRARFAPNLVFVAATTMLVISVVKTSLALSLGLVGALSIFRFRTPIKEPEELAYLFLSVALGVGVGADQELISVSLVLGILLYMGVTATRAPRESAGLLVHIQSPEPLEPADEGLRALVDSMGSASLGVDLRRLDLMEKGFEATVRVEVASQEQLGLLMADLRRRLPKAHLTAVETDGLD